MEDPRFFGMYDTFFGITADISRHSGIRIRRPAADDPSQIMSPSGLNHEIHILPRFESGAECNGKRRHVPAGAQILLGKDRIHHYFRLEGSDRIPFWIHQDRYFSLIYHFFYVLTAANQNRRHSLYQSPAIIDCFTDSHLPPDRCRMFRFQNQHRKARRPQSMDRSCRQITAAADNDQFLHLYHFLLSDHTMLYLLHLQ